VDTKKVERDGGGRYWNSLLDGEWSSKPIACKISITLHQQCKKKEPRSPRGSGRSCIFGGGGGMGQAAKAKAKAFQTRPLVTTWPLHGPIRPQHGRNRQNDELAFWLFVQNFLPKLQKKLSLMFRHSYLACLLSWRTPLPFRLGWL
jgi:hypothetical protein